MTIFPSVEQVAHDLYYTAKNLTRRDGETDVRLQVYANGSWAIRVGPSDYDSDHHGFWGSGVISPSDTKESAKAVAEEMLAQAREQAAEEQE